jgi:oxygen-independent coproporphyrinogen-3 oxidase
MNSNLIDKYNVPGPRYTSYPTVPYWDEAGFTYKAWEESFQRAFAASNESEGISLYVHLPFCESLCTFCACNKRITKNHGLENPYIAALLKEWGLYVERFGGRPIIKEIHLGGGTPTFFSPDNLKVFLEGIYAKADIHPGREFSFEGHPNNTTEAHLRALHELGFRRVSFGVQDYDERVQKAIHRVQPFEAVQRATELSRSIGYDSIGHDLIFGLPFQTLDGVIRTIEQTKSLQPDRIAYYSYAHVPWIKGNGQRGFNDDDLPSGDEKRSFYEQGKQLLEKLGYAEIGMDHFALPHDELYRSMVEHRMHRNFMGYSSSKTTLMVGLGVSSISDSWFAFAQNEKRLEDYEARIGKGELAIMRGHILTPEDLTIRRTILDLMCHMRADWTDALAHLPESEGIRQRLREFEADGLLQDDGHQIVVLEAGRPFVRNICMALDLRLLRKAPETRLFSMTV